MNVGLHRAALSFLMVATMEMTSHSFGHALENASTPSIEMAGLAGEWEIQEEDKSYIVTLNEEGTGPYTWQDGRIATTECSDRKWSGTWQQTGNDREGGFELLLSEDNMEARGVWWYTRVGDRKNIPPRQWGGSYVWKRLTSRSAQSGSNP